MPDGDKVHARLSGRYQKAYQQLCEGQFGDQELAREVLRALQKDLQRYGSEPITLLKQVAAQLKELPTEPHLKRAVNWRVESQKIDSIHLL